MLDFSKENEMLRKYTSNYRINIISLQDLDANCFNTGLRELIGMMQRSGSTEEMREYCRENEERFQNLDEDTYDVISVMTNHRSLTKEKSRYREKEGGLNMWKAFEDWEKMARQEGREEGREEGEQAGEQKFAMLVGRLMEDGRIEDVRKAVKNEKKRKALYKEYGLKKAYQ